MAPLTLEGDILLETRLKMIELQIAVVVALEVTVTLLAVKVVVI